MSPALIERARKDRGGNRAIRFTPLQVVLTDRDLEQRAAYRRYLWEKG